MKAHLVIRESPLQGSIVDALCGAEIFPAQIVLMWDSAAMGQPLDCNTLLVCRKCWDRLLCQKDCGARYVYGVIRAQEQGTTEEELEVVA